MSTQLYDRLDAEVKGREWADGQAEMSMLAEIYEGKLPESLKAFFPKNQPRHLINMVKLAWNDLATQIGRVPEFRHDTLNDSDAELKRVGLLEKIAHSYLRDADPSAPMFMWQLAWWLIGVGRAVAIVKPDMERNRPIFDLKDPRTAYPRAKRMSGNAIMELADIIFKYEIPTKTAEAMGLRPRMVEVSRGFGHQVTWEKPDKTTIIEYVDDKRWTIVSDGGSVIDEEHNLGMVPAHVFQSFAPNQEWGLSLFKDQVSFMVAISRLMTQKLAFGDQLVNPMIWVKGHEGKLRIGPQTLNRLSPQGAMGIITPPQQLQVDQDIAILERFSRILNKNPESRSGEVQNRGTYTSAKTLEQLSEAIDSTIGQYWDIIGVGMAYLLKVAYKMEETIWPNMEKSITGNLGGKRFRDKYIPKKDIKGRYFVRVDYGFGIGGYQGFLMHLQAKDAGVMPKRQAMEAMPGISDVDEALRQIELEGMDEAGMVNFQTQASQGGLDQVVWAKMRTRMAKKRIPLAEVILEYETELQAQAQAAAGSEDVSALTTPPQEGAPGEAAPQPAGVNPGVLG